MSDKESIISYKWQTKQQSSSTLGRQSSNYQLRMADKAAMIIYTRLTKQQ
jgi:hypothetical protein